MPVDYRQVGLADAAIGKQLAQGGDGSLAAAKDQYATCVFIEAVHMPQKTDAPAGRPAVAIDDRAHQQHVEIVCHAPGVFGRELPAGRFVDGDDRTVLMQDRDPETRQSYFR